MSASLEQRGRQVRLINPDVSVIQCVIPRFENRAHGAEEKMMDALKLADVQSFLSYLGVLTRGPAT